MEYVNPFQLFSDLISSFFFFFFFACLNANQKERTERREKERKTWKYFPEIIIEKMKRRRHAQAQGNDTTQRNAWNPNPHASPSSSSDYLLLLLFFFFSHPFSLNGAYGSINSSTFLDGINIIVHRPIRFDFAAT